MSESSLPSPEEITALFERAMDALRQAAERGHGPAKKLYESLANVDGTSRVSFEPASLDLWLRADDGDLRCTPKNPGGSKLMEVGLPHSMVLEALDRFRGLAEEADLAKGIDAHLDPAGASRAANFLRLLPTLAAQPVGFHLVIADPPAAATELTLKLALGQASTDDAPDFVMRVAYDDLAAVQKGTMAPMELFLGRVRIEGDASKAMALGLSAVSVFAGPT